MKSIKGIKDYENNYTIYVEVSGAIESDNSYSYKFKLPYPDSDKLYIKFEGSDYKIEGKWSFKLE